MPLHDPEPRVTPLEDGRPLRPGTRAAWLLAFAAIFSSSALAQTSGDPFSGQLDYSLPGARSLAMGGAFAAIADDATAPLSNPAGMMQLSRPMAAVEARYTRVDSSRPDFGHAFGSPSFVGTDRVAGVSELQLRQEDTALSGLSFVYPRRNWSVGVFGQRFPSYRSSWQTQGVFYGPPGDTNRLAPERTLLDVDIERAGVAIARRITESFSVGIGAALYDLRLDGRTEMLAEPPGAGRPRFDDPAARSLTTTRMGDDQDMAFNAGLFWRVSKTWSVGATYDQGPDLRYDAEAVTGPGNAAGPGLRATVAGNPFPIADAYRVGVAFRPSTVWTFAFQYDFVGFSDLESDFRSTALSQLGLPTAADRIVVDDAHRFRLGGEWLWVCPVGILAFRAGVWFDPDHAPRFVGDDAGTGAPDPEMAVRLPGGDSEWHWTYGVGWVVLPRFQLDLGADVSDLYHAVSATFQWRF